MLTILLIVWYCRDHEASRKAAVAELHLLSKQEKDMVKDSQEKQAIATYVPSPLSFSSQFEITNLTFVLQIACGAFPEHHLHLVGFGIDSNLWHLLGRSIDTSLQYWPWKRFQYLQQAMEDDWRPIRIRLVRKNVKLLRPRNSEFL